MRHVVSECPLEIRSVWKGMPTEYSLVLFGGSFESFPIFIFDKPFPVEKARLELAFINKLLINELPSTLVLVVDEGSYVFSFFVFELFLPESVP